MRRSIVCFSVLVCLLIAGVQVGASEKSRESSSGIFENRCSACHELGRSKSGGRTNEEWEHTVMRMKNEHKAAVTSEDAKEIIDYLSYTYHRIKE